MSEIFSQKILFRLRCGLRFSCRHLEGEFALVTNIQSHLEPGGVRGGGRGAAGKGFLPLVSRWSLLGFSYSVNVWIQALGVQHADPGGQDGALAFSSWQSGGGRGVQRDTEPSGAPAQCPRVTPPIDTCHQSQEPIEAGSPGTRHKAQQMLSHEWKLPS